MQWIKTKADFQALCKQLGIREDWHDPDLQGINVSFMPGTLNNAMLDETESSLTIWQNSKPVGRINMACLLAWASKTSVQLPD